MMLSAGAGMMSRNRALSVHFNRSSEQRYQVLHGYCRVVQPPCAEIHTKYDHCDTRKVSGSANMLDANLRLWRALDTYVSLAIFQP